MGDPYLGGGSGIRHRDSRESELSGAGARTGGEGNFINLYIISWGPKIKLSMILQARTIYLCGGFIMLNLSFSEIFSETDLLMFHVGVRPNRTPFTRDGRLAGITKTKSKQQRNT